MVQTSGPIPYLGTQLLCQMPGFPRWRHDAGARCPQSVDAPAAAAYKIQFEAAKFDPSAFA